MSNATSIQRTTVLRDDPTYRRGDLVTPETRVAKVRVELERDRNVAVVGVHSNRDDIQPETALTICVEFRRERIDLSDRP
jgi:hypothetical protein